MWPLLVLTGAKMLYDADAAERKRTVDAAGVRYSPWSGLSKLPFEDSRPVDAAIQGYTGYTGMEQAQKESDFKDRLAESQIDVNKAKASRLRSGGVSMMNLWDAPQEPAMGPPNGYDYYSRRNPWGGF